MTHRLLVLGLTLCCFAGCSEDVQRRTDGPLMIPDKQSGKDIKMTEGRLGDGSRGDIAKGDKGTAVDKITITSPAGGEEWSVGSTQQIRWTTNLQDVTISYSINNGTTWKPIVQSVDNTSAGWLNYAWKVPDAPSTTAKIQIVGYFGEAPAASNTFVIK